MLVLAVIVGIGSTIFGEFTAGFTGEPTIEGQRAAEVGVRIVPSSADKCPRCWRYGHGIGSVVSHPVLCKRCGDALTT